jgi:hypothetical protein
MTSTKLASNAGPPTGGVTASAALAPGIAGSIAETVPQIDPSWQRVASSVE